MTTLVEIEEKTKAFAKQRSTLVQRLMMLNESIEQVKRKHLRSIKEAVNETAAAKAELNALLANSANLFIKPKTLIFHGVKVGFAKQKGKIEIADEVKTIMLIRKHMPDQAALLIDTKESVSKKALANIAAADMKRIGATIIADSDEVVINPTDSEVEKMVNAFLKEPTEEVQA